MRPLRILLKAIGGVMLGAGVLIGFSSSVAPMLPLMIWGGILIIVGLIENWRYHPPKTGLNSDWIKTEECFIDPATQQLNTVYYNPKTGERKYQSDENEVR